MPTQTSAAKPGAELKSAATTISEPSVVEVVSVASHGAETTTFGITDSASSPTTSVVAIAPVVIAPVSVVPIAVAPVAAAPVAATPATPTPQRDPGASTVLISVIQSTDDNTGISSVQRIPFRSGVSSVTVERLARQAGCTGGRGAALITEEGPVEVYRMICDTGAVFMAKCDMRQCSPMN